MKRTVVICAILLFVAAWVLSGCSDGKAAADCESRGGTWGVTDSIVTYTPITVGNTTTYIPQDIPVYGCIGRSKKVEQ